MLVRKLRGKGGRIAHLVRDDGGSLCGYLPCRMSRLIQGLRVPTKWIAGEERPVCRECEYLAEQLRAEITGKSQPLR